ncbi:helix-turn-helix transcriptional regulator [Streptomyces sp. AK02-04a]|uniref:helix-turn-helix transcriptional regulator n=1 Tax=Streptomyces sp. AK02-04a TaxID=3028649 RepID=UPI0029B7D6D5|nr:AAA family ATPase [Streptomyces sp. AK02-04a]MDX3762749.1 AAA family ATPase [Streptomyces sp. AK02-04a]
MTRKDSNVIGRREELSLLRELIAPPHKESHVLLLLGDPGLGKTVLLAEAAREARAAGMRVLATTGRESEQDLAFAGLHQLLRPVLDRVARLPTRQAEALRGAFGLSDDPAPPDALLTGIAVLTLLSELSDERPLLVTADDTQWLDRASLDSLAFAARRLESEQLVLLAGARGNVPPAGFERDLPQLLLRPLTRPDAGLLLDAQPRPPHGRLREQVLTQAVGNPLALIELARVIAADPDAGRRWTAEPLPLTGQLTALMAAQYVTLPPAARSALLLAAAADSPDLTMAIPGLSADALASAEAAGLIRLDTPGPRFAHPLTRSAVYHAAPFAERAAARRQVADALRDQPDRHAWHLAAAALEPDEHLAALLEDSAAQAQRRGGAAAAARALERAAELSPGEPDKARRLLAAAELALPAGQADWVRELAGKVLTLTSDPDLRIAARLDIGWSLLWSNRNADAFDTLLSVAAEASPRLPAIAWQATWMAATVAHQTGLPEVCARARAALDLLDSRDGPPPSAEDWPAGRADEYRIWIRACTDPFGERADIVPRLRRTAGGSLSDPGTFGAAAWVLNETELAVRVLREALSRLRAPGVRGASGGVLSALAWACVDSGRWDDALAAAREAGDIAAAYKMETVAGSADLTTAIVAAGEHDQVAPLLARVRAAVDTSEYGGFAARIWQTAGLAALAQGTYVTAYAQLRRLFAADGTPLHHHFSYLAVADLASAAVRAERHLEARTLLERALARVDPAPGPRLAQLTARARGLLAEPDSAEADFAAPLADPTGDTWPFERAQLQLDYGEWLRRQRRINDAKPILVTALETFRRLGAAPWTRRAESEQRACGVTVQAPQGAPGALDGLTAQQREIVVLAGHGLTNGEIADRLFLSPRTVASHLYRSYPKLGIAGRRQLRDIIDQQITPGAGR